MGAAFDKWLARPSTICLLQEVLAATDNSSTPRARRLLNHAHTPKRRLSTLSSFWQDVNIKVGAEATETGTAERECLENCRAAAPRESFQERAFKALWMQANDVSSPRLASLVIDRPEYRHDFKRWIELLNQRHRLDGLAGIVDVWKSMRFRQIDLPTAGENADILWPLFINAAIPEAAEDKQPELLQSILEHAKDLHLRHDTLYPGLYKCLVGRCFRIKPVIALPWHNTFVNHHGVVNVDLHGIADDCAASANKSSEKTRKYFLKLYRSTGQHNLYDYFIPKLLERTDPTNALRWHRMFIFEGDGPSAEVFALPEVQWLFRLDGDTALPMIHKRDSPTSLSTGSNSGPQFPPLTRATMSTLVGEAHGIRQKEVSDNFVAKLFATRSFSLGFVMSGLSFFAIERLGPLAVREMALKSGNLDAFQKKLGELQDMGIGIGDSAYGRLMERIAQDGDIKLFDAILMSDQHPEAYDDHAAQELLLQSFLSSADALNAHITLIALSLTGEVQYSRAWNRLLQHYIKSEEYDAVAKTMQHVQTSKMILSRRTLTFMHRHLLSPRRPAMAPTHSPKESLVLMPLQFTTKAYIHAAVHGTRVDEKLWIENLKRFAMLRKWDEFERLVRWLVWWYKDHDRASAIRRGNQLLNQPSMLNLIFSREMKRAIVSWGFRDASFHYQLRRQPQRRVIKRNGKRLSSDIPCEPWAKGLWLLKDLDGRGFRTSPDIIRHALRLRLWILFGPAFSTKAINEEARRFNELDLSHYIRHANEIWDGKVFCVDSTLLDKDDPQSQARLLVAIFGTRFRVNRKTGEYADVAAYARVFGPRQRKPLRRRTITQRQMWQHSAFRLVRKVRIEKPSFDQPEGTVSTSNALLQPQQHLSHAVHSSNSHPQPNPQDTRECFGPYSPLPG